MPQRLDFIDCLRGLAILMVLLVHSGQAVTGLPDWLQHFTEYGGRGVQLFFIVSALTLMQVYHGRPFSRRAFFMRRFFRVAPMFYLGLVFYGMLREQATPAQLLLTATFLHGWSFDAINRVVPGGWTIANEAMFYVLLPLLLVMLTNLRKSLVVFAVSLVVSRASFVLIPQIFVGHATTESLQQFAAFCFPTQLPAFIGGIVVYHALAWLKAHPVEKIYAILYPKGETCSVVPSPQGGGGTEQALMQRKIITILCCVMIAATLLLCATSPSPTLHNYLFADLLLMLLVMAVAFAQPRVLVNRTMRTLGRISYSMYLVHFVVLDGLKAVLLPSITYAASTQQLLLVYGCTLIVSAAIASLTWRFIEQPMIAWGRRVSARCSV